MPYPFTEIEQTWQDRWEQDQTFRTPDEIEPDKPKYYVLDMFPYPSGSGLHVGHPEGYTATDIVARYKRMQGVEVLHPMGWDAFGLPAEQYALETGTHPETTTRANIDRFRAQLKALGFSYDWSREVSTTDPAYYRWTQWIFLQLYNKGLAFQADVPVNWCPALGTVLANEEVVDGKSERGNHPVIRKPMRQWVLKITEYAERLLQDLEDLDWPESIKDMQRNWIGRSEGADVDFPVQNLDRTLRVYTTRPDTLFGATYMVLAPEHEWVDELTSAEQREAVDTYRRQAAGKSDLERTELQKEKTGVFTGAYAVNPVTGEAIPIWIADYVLSGYGTGAIMAVPAHDERDYEFARTFDLPIREVISGGDIQTEAFTGDGTLVHSSSDEVQLDGLAVPEAKAEMIRWLESKGIGQGKVNYRLRDWLFSRQRYWGEPFPILFVDGEAKPLPESELPVMLPDVESYQPTGSGESPLAAIDEWVHTEDPETGNPALRETNTMPQWAGSCWYYLRFIDPANSEALVDPEKEKYWMPVDLYVGGAEHAVLHLLYARFWHKVLYDVGAVSTPEPFGRLVNQGMILGEMEYLVYRDTDGTLISADQVETMSDVEMDDLQAERCKEADVEKRGQGFVLSDQPDIRVHARAHKMSKSRGNVINPDVVIEAYGADSLRLYEMFMGPLEQVKPWSMKGVEGVHRFLSRVWRLITDDRDTGFSDQLQDVEPDREMLRELHGVIRKVTEDIESLRFNTAIAAMMEFLNYAQKCKPLPLEAARTFILLLSPFAPHLAEECHARLGSKESLAYAKWPEWDEECLKVDEIEIPVQINGKVRGKIRVPSGADNPAMIASAKADDQIQPHLADKQIMKEIAVPGRLVNLVVK